MEDDKERDKTQESQPQPAAKIDHPIDPTRTLSQMDKIRLELMKKGEILLEPVWPSHLAFNLDKKTLRLIDILPLGKKMTAKKGRHLSIMKDCGMEIEVIIYASRGNIQGRIQRLPFDGMDVRIIESMKEDLRRETRMKKTRNRVRIIRQRAEIMEPLVYGLTDAQKPPKLNEARLDGKERNELAEMEDLFGKLTNKVADKTVNKAVREEVEEGESQTVDLTEESTD